MSHVGVSSVVHVPRGLWLAAMLTILAAPPTALAVDLGPAFTIASGVASANSDTTNPGRPTVAFDGTNYLVVTCRTLGAPSGLVGVMVSPGGAILRTFQIASSTCPIRAPVAFDGDNYLIVFWRDGQMVAARVSPSGDVLDVVPSGISWASPADVAFDGVNYLVALQAFTSTWDIHAARVTPGGQVLGTFPVFVAPGEQVSPSVAFDGANYLVVWRHTRSGSGPSFDTDIYGARVTPGGVVLDPAGIAISTASGVQGEPRVTFGAGSYFVAWVDYRSGPGFPSGYGHIVGTRVAPDGTILDGPPGTGGIPIHTAAQLKANPVVTFDGTNYVAAWEVGAYPNVPPAGIFAAGVSPAGQLLDGPSATGPVRVSAPPCATCKLVHPSLASDGAAVLLAWVNNAETIGTSKDVVGMTGCGSVAVDEPASPCFGVASADYLPLAPGTTWTYRADDGTVFTSVVLDQTVDVNGVATRVVRNSVDGSEELYTNDGGGIRLHRTFDPGTFVPDLGVVDLVATFEPPLQLTRAAMRIGTTVRSSGSAVTNSLPGAGVLVLSYDATATLLAVETVTVPAGTFEVLRLEVAITLSGYGVSETTTTIFSVARSLGVVRRTTTDSEGTESVHLVDTSARPVLAVRRPATAGGSVTSVPDGIACGSDCSAAFARGTTVTLTAAPTPHSVFTGWSGGGCSGTGSCTVTLDAGAAVTATFAPRLVTLTVTLAGSGTVASVPAGIACGSDCTETLPSGTTVTLIATPAADSVFVGWSGGDCSGTGPCTVAVADTVVTATFAPARVALGVTRAGTGSGKVGSSPAGIACGADCAEIYALGTMVTLTARAAGGSTFTGWTGACSGLGSCVVTMDQARSVTATFTVRSALRVRKSGDGAGTVSSGLPGIQCGSDCVERYPEDTPVTLVATPANGSVFAGWIGCTPSAGTTCTVTLRGITTVIARFARGATAILRVRRSGSGSGTVTASPTAVACRRNCDLRYPVGTIVTLTAMPASGSLFTGWRGCSSPSGSSCTLTVNGGASVAAEFSRAP